MIKCVPRYSNEKLEKVLPYKTKGSNDSGGAVLTFNNQIMTVTSQGGCALTYFVEPSVGEIDLSDGGDSATGDHLLSVNFWNEDIALNGICLQNKAQSEGGWILENWRIKQVNDLTIETCFEACKYEKYAGLGAGQNCFCGDELRFVDVLSDTACNMNCFGNPTQQCGGDNKWHVYSIASPETFTGECIDAVSVADGGPVRALAQFSLAITLEICLEQCKNFKFAALGNGENCFCLENIPNYNFLPDSNCNKPCNGDPANDKCGGSGKFSIYSVETPEPFTGQCMQDFNDADGNPVIDMGTVFTGLTIEQCLDACKSFKYALVQNGNDCHCANEFLQAAEILPDSECNMPCVADPAQTCGGSSKFNLYTVNIYTAPLQWTTWTDWSDCSSSCGGGEMTRSRTCQSGCYSFTEDLLQTQVCNEVTCPG